MAQEGENSNCVNRSCYIGIIGFNNININNNNNNNDTHIKEKHNMNKMVR